MIWVGLNLNPHPLKAEGAAPNCRFLLSFIGIFGVAECDIGGYWRELNWNLSTTNPKVGSKSGASYRWFFFGDA